MGKKANLTDAEDALWEQSFADASTRGLSDEDADEEAWRIVQEEFPRLREFEGCE